jgi:protein-S-isoprenylcysteine O-methyltransferase Ste14
MVTYAGVALGVALAVVYPVLKGYIKKQFPPVAALSLPPWVKKYTALLVFSLITALILLAVYRANNPDTDLGLWKALLLGFGWEASMEKLITTKP